VLLSQWERENGGIAGMQKTWRYGSVAVLVLAALMLARLFFQVEARAYEAVDAPAAPPFTQKSASEWINAEPLTWADLRGQVVLLDVWTFDCWNCYRSIPWLSSLEDRFGQQGFRIVGIHTPEFEHEKRRANVEAKMKKFGVRGAVMLDNDYRYWNALDNHYWPAFYLVDRQGHIRGRYVGETHFNDPKAQKVEAHIAKLLRENP